MSAATCNRCGQRPPAPNLGWCRPCVAAEDRRRRDLAAEHGPRPRFAPPIVEIHADGSTFFAPAKTIELDARERRARSAARLEELLRHARRTSQGKPRADGVFEAAIAARLESGHRGALSLALQRLDPKWRIPIRNRALFALELVADGWKRADAIAAAMISRSTLQRELRKSARPAKWARKAHLEALRPQKWGQNAALQSHVDVSVEGSEGDWTSPAEMTHSGAESAAAEPQELER
jgi:hypothetical protein